MLMPADLEPISGTHGRKQMEELTEWICLRCRLEAQLLERFLQKDHQVRLQKGWNKLVVTLNESGQNH